MDLDALRKGWKYLKEPAPQRIMQGSCWTRRRQRRDFKAGSPRFAANGWQA
jgi:hypothetical protein